MENVKHRTWHSKSRSRLAQKGLKIGALVNPYLDVAQLKEYGICVSQSDLAESEHLPQYFRPASPETLASLEDRRQKLPRPPQPGDLDYYEDDHRLALANYWQARTNSHQLTVQWLNGPTYDQEGPNLLQTTTWGTKGYETTINKAKKIADSRLATQYLERDRETSAPEHETLRGVSAGMEFMRYFRDRKPHPASPRSMPPQPGL
jgi:hypothetical protein